MTAASHAGQEVPGWRDLRHGGLLLDGQRLADLASHAPDYVGGWTEHQLRRRATDEAPAFVKFVLEDVCGFDSGSGTWTRGTKVALEWSRRAPTGEVVKPRQLWEGLGGGRLPVFMEPGPRVGIGKGRRTVSRVLGWLRAGNDHLALITNGKQWRLLFAGLDFEAWCEWDVDLWFQEGKPAPQVEALRTLLQPKLWTPASKDAASPLLQAIRDTRKGQAELSETLGERVRKAVEILIQGHGEALKEQCSDVDPADIYRAACRVAMRLVVILFAEARDLLPRDNPVYHASYGLNGLMERLQSAVGGHALSHRFSAWPQVQALFTLVHDGSHLPQMPVKDYGGELFKPGSAESADGLSRALAVFETACLKHDVLPDDDVRRMLDRMTLTRVRIRQGRGGTWVTVPVDFSDLSSDYIGILYEGLLDYELKTAPPGEPVIFLAAGQYPALPLSRLEAMDDKAIKALFSNLKKDVAADDDGPEESEGQAAVKGEANEAEGAAEPLVADPSEASPDGADPRFANRTRAEKWARRAAHVAGLVKKPRGKLTPERRLKAEDDLARKARKLVARVVLPGEWYLVRWGGTRKGSGSFYTRPGLVVPTVQRTLRPLAYDPPLGKDGEPDRDAPAAKWTPKRPEQILELKVCDPACGSGAFVLSALRFLTNALFASLQRHGRIEPDGERTLIRLLGAPTEHEPHTERLGDELIPCPQDHDDFEPRLRAVLRRHVVERCIYAVDIDPLAVELCRLSLWIETMDRGLPFGFLDHKVKCGNSLVGAWLDQFAHYPVMAWKNREGGDKNHGNGIHFKKGARTKAIKAFVKDRLTPDLASFLRDPDLFLDDHLQRHDNAHRSALAVLEKMHALPVQDATERARLYRDEFVGSPAWSSLKEAMDLWCACWFWPADEIECAPVPTTFANPSMEAKAVARRVSISADTRFFHWELEFPDVFREAGSGFDAVLGNPPWDIAKPNSHEFFSNIDPLYRSYGKQEAIRKQTSYFDDAASGEGAEEDWINHNARFRSQSNWVKYAARPFGDPTTEAKSVDRFSIERGNANGQLHGSWRRMRDSHSVRFADPSHPFRRQGSADLNLYKLFLEVSYSLLKPAARMGLIVPSGLYSDYGTAPLRALFLEHCKWEWLFGFENRNRVFPIHRSYKFNPVVLQKGGSTDTIHTAFMRHDLDEWGTAEAIVIPYSRTQVEQFSPKTRALLEICSIDAVELLEQMYETGVLLGDSHPDGWNIEYTHEFHITNDSKLFPPLPQWEAKGYNPDEYGRWLQGKWRPIGELWAELGVDPSRPVPVDVGMEEWLFDTTLGSERREAQPTHGQLLRPGDIAHSSWEVRCAQPPYSRLPVPRIAIPPGVVLSREVDSWIYEEDVESTALPLYEGRMLGQFDFSQKGWVSGKGRGAVWRTISWQQKHIEPQFLMNTDDYLEIEYAFRPKVMHMRKTSSTNRSTAIAVFAWGFPSGDNAACLYLPQLQDALALSAVLNSLVFDYVTRCRLVGISLDYHVLEQNPLPGCASIAHYASLGLASLAARLTMCSHCYAPPLLQIGGWSMRFAITGSERLRQMAVLDALVAVTYGLRTSHMANVIAGCDLPVEQMSTGQRDPKGFWRIHKDRDPELRRPNLSLVALSDLQSKIQIAGPERGVRMFLSQNHGEGWLIPETLALADYGLGHDERAKHAQPVASRLGPRFFDWQLAQSPDEAWRECHLHARNLLGAREYRKFLRDVSEDPFWKMHRDMSPFPHDDTRRTVGDTSRLGNGVVSQRQPMLRAAEPRTEYASDLFGTDDPS